MKFADMTTTTRRFYLAAHAEDVAYNRHIAARMEGIIPTSLTEAAWQFAKADLTDAKVLAWEEQVEEGLGSTPAERDSFYTRVIRAAIDLA